MGFLAPYWYQVLGAVVLVFTVTGLGIVNPLITEQIIDVFIPNGQMNMLLLFCSLVVGLAILKGLLTFCQRYVMEYTAQRAIYDIRNRLYQHLQELSFSFYDQAQTGELMSRLTADVETLRNFLGMGLINLTTNALTIVFILTILIRKDWKLTVVSLCTMPFLIWAVAQFATKVRPTFRQVQEQMAKLTSVLQENVTGVRVVRAFAREEHEIEKFDQQNRTYYTKNLTSVRLQAYYGPLMNFVSGIMSTLVLWYGGYEVINGHLSVGSWMAFNTLLIQLIMPVRMFGWLVSLFQRAAASGQRIFEVLDTKSEVADAPDATVLPPVSGQVRFENVHFSYDKRTPVLEGINLEAEPGQTIAILGATGSGKSSVINLIPRFYDPTEGRVLIDGHDIRKVTLDSLRRQIGIVLQETFLFSASIKENIAYGKPDASMEEISEAAKAAHIHDFIVSLPQGYDTVIGERGVGLSGGQKQRVAIARALLMDARILILDESTSSVDTETEYAIQQAFAKLMERCTTFVIAQRLSTVRNAHKIVVLDKGHIGEEGTHEELLRRGGIYSQIYEMQLRPQEKGEVSDPGYRAAALGGDC